MIRRFFVASALVAGALALTAACGAKVETPAGTVEVPNDAPSLSVPSEIPNISVPPGVTNEALVIALEQNGFKPNANKTEYTNDGGITIVMGADGSPESVKYNNQFLECKPTTGSVILALTTSAVGGTDQEAAERLCA